MEGVEWFGLFVPIGMPNDVVSGLNTAVRRGLDFNAIRTSFAKQSFEQLVARPPS